jgi:hypothetical protein
MATGDRRMNEKDLENQICALLRAGAQDPTQLQRLSFYRSTSDARSLGDLIGGRPFTLFQDTSDWNLQQKFMVEICGGMTPDIVVRSNGSGQNRIYFEVKRTRELGYGKADSQVVRYLLHLLATSESKPSRSPDDIRRAIVLAAPLSWFAVPANADVWDYFLATYGPLASAFGVTLAGIHLPDA